MKNSEGKIIFPDFGETAIDDTPSVMKFYKLPQAFPSEVLEEAHRCADRLKCPGKRLDLRKKFIFTCDPKSARDYDDALSLETNRRGHRILGVHIADVSHFVRPGGAIDQEAFRRSTSVYFVDRVLPMLPEELCNGLCSLVPNEDRLTFSVFMTFDKNGEMIATSFSKSIIRSRARLTYEEVGSILDGHEAGSLKKSELKTIREIAALTQTLREKRFANGALDLEMPESEILLDENSRMYAMMQRPYDSSHQMIEEGMVAANEAVAKELWSNGVKILARLHEPPAPEKIMMLRAELRGLGYKVGNLENPKIFANFLQTIKKSPIYSTLAMMVLRSMKKAVYDGRDMGHFGLAKRFYAHFTSPIRRYPDLTLHRQLTKYLSNGIASARVMPRELARWAKHTTEAEQIAMEAERAVAEMKKYRFAEELLHSGGSHRFEVVIVKCTSAGCFVEIPGFEISGFIHVRYLSYQYVRFNPSDQTLSAPGGKKWRLGMRLRAELKHVDLQQRRIDFIPCRH